jgi:hypothetical protein
MIKQDRKLGEQSRVEHQSWPLMLSPQWDDEESRAHGLRWSPYVEGMAQIAEDSGVRAADGTVPSSAAGDRRLVDGQVKPGSTAVLGDGMI